MISRLASRNARGAARILQGIFGGIRGDFAFRLWDGTTVGFGACAAAFTVVIHAPETFARLLRDPSPMSFAEAYVQGAIDLDGDIFAVMPVANAVEDLRIPLGERLRLLAGLVKS